MSASFHRHTFGKLHKDTRVAGSSPNVDIDAMCIWIRYSNLYGSRVNIAQLKKDNHTCQHLTINTSRGSYPSGAALWSSSAYSIHRLSVTIGPICFQPYGLERTIYKMYQYSLKNSFKAEVLAGIFFRVILLLQEDNIHYLVDSNSVYRW